MSQIILSSLSWSWVTSPAATRATSSRFFFNFLLLFGLRWIKPLVDVLLNEHWSDGFNSLKKANIKHWSDGLNSLKMANIKKKSLKTCLLKIWYWVLHNQEKACKSRRIRQRMDKVHGSNWNFLIIIGHCIYTRMNTAQWHVTDNKTFSLIHTHLCWLSDIQTQNNVQLSVTKNCIKELCFLQNPLL